MEIKKATVEGVKFRTMTKTRLQEIGDITWRTEKDDVLWHSPEHQI
jgi:hypothetical protein